MTIIHAMDHGWPRSIVTALGILTCGLLGLLAATFPMSAFGVVPPALIDAASLPPAIIGTFLCLSVAAVLALSLAKPINAAVSLFAFGFGVATFAMRTGTVSDAVFQNGNFRWLGAETLAWGLIAASMAIAAFRVGGPLPDVPVPDSEQTFMQGLLRKKSLLMLLSGIAAPAVIALTLIGQGKGQSIGACTLAGVVVAVAARLFAPREQPIFLFAAPAIVIGLTQIVLSGQAISTLDSSFAMATLSPILCAMPADVAAGSLCGVAIGLGWSKGLVKPAAEE